MKEKIICILIAIPFLTFSQEYKRTVYNYETLKLDTLSICEDSVIKDLENSFIALQENNSKKAVNISKQLYEKNNCPQVYEVYGYSLFRSGDWFEGLKIIESGIEKFGQDTNLIKRKVAMSIEMAQLGLGMKAIDGNSVYKANSLKYDEEQFKTENYKSALADLEYLVKINNKTEDKFFIAKINQLLQNYELSNELFKTLLDVEEYKNAASFNISENYIFQKRYKDAEIELNKLVALNPREGLLYEKLSEIYELQNEKSKSEEYNRKSFYYNNVPGFLDLDYTDKNFELLTFFSSEDKKANKKLKRLTNIFENESQDFTINVCLMILKLHANHGNGVEEKATEILEKIGEPCIKKVHLLFQSNVSTCTLTNLADVMATVKDDESWNLLKNYLPKIATMPMTLIPPTIPESMIKFNEEKGVREILLLVKDLLAVASESDNKDVLQSGYHQYAYYYPLESISKELLKRIATELNYTEKEFNLLEEKLK